MKNLINLNIPNLIGNEKKYIKNCLDKNWISTAGNYINKFEIEVAKFTKSKFAVSFINGTSSLHIALKVVGVNKNTEVIVPTLTFIAPVNAIIYNGAKPIFMDCDEYHNIDTLKTIDFLKKCTVFKNGKTYNKQTKKVISAIVVVHVWGNAVDIEDLHNICSKKNIKIIEDASESLGTYYTKGRFKGKHAGTVGDIGCISFNGNKIITSGGGGMLITNKKDYSVKAHYYSTQSKNNSIWFIHNDIGYNYRMTNIHAAIGLGQIEKISLFIQKKKFINNFYKKNITNSKIELLNNPDYAFNNNWLNVIKIININKKKLQAIIKYFYANNIEVRPVWRLNHKQKKNKNYFIYDIKKSLLVEKQCLCIPSSTNLTKNDLKKVVQLINKI